MTTFDRVFLGFVACCVTFFGGAALATGYPMWETHKDDKHDGVISYYHCIYDDATLTEDLDHVVIDQRRIYECMP